MINIGWKLDFTDKYVIGSDKELYKLPFESASGKKISLRKINLIHRETSGYWLNYRGKLEWWSLNKLRPHTVKVRESAILVGDDYPF